MIKVYKDGNELIHVTDNSPSHFKGVLFTVYKGSSPESVEESLMALNQFRDLEQIDLGTLGPGWCDALHISQKAASKTAIPPGIPADSQESQGAFYIPVNLNLMGVSVPFFMLMAILSVLVIGVNGPFLSLCIGASCYAVIYHCCALHVIKKQRVG